jgi:probable rRNA maturation factor
MPVHVRDALRRKVLHRSRLQTLAQHILSEAGAADTELSVSVVGDRRMRRLNRQYRGLDRSTDVLAFAMREAPKASRSMLGDVVISIDTAFRQARAAKHSVDREVVMLLIHGILHLLGYDHERNPREAHKMQGKEQAVIRALQPIPRLFRMPRDK